MLLPCSTCSLFLVFFVFTTSLSGSCLHSSLFFNRTVKQQHPTIPCLFFQLTCGALLQTLAREYTLFRLIPSNATNAGEMNQAMNHTLTSYSFQDDGKQFCVFLCCCRKSKHVPWQAAVSQVQCSN